MDYKYVNDYEVLYRIEEKDDYAEDILYKKYYPAIKNTVIKYLPLVKNKGLEIDDLIQEGYLGLSNAIRTYRDNQNVLFYSYACLCIERQISTCCRRASSRKQEILNNSYFDDYIFNNLANDFEYNSLDNIGDNISAYEDFIEYKSMFNFIDGCVFELRYNGFSYREISELLDLSISTVDGKLSKVRKTLHSVVKKTI